jgi:hypothetical protein
MAMKNLGGHHGAVVATREGFEGTVVAMRGGWARAVRKVVTFLFSSDCLLTVGASTALSQTGFDYDKFKQRGGEYAL